MATRPRRASALRVVPDEPEAEAPGPLANDPDGPAGPAPVQDEPADVLVPRADPPAPAPAPVRYNVELRLLGPTKHGDIEIGVQLTGDEIARLLAGDVRWLRFEAHPSVRTHPHGETRYLNVENGVGEIIVYGDWRPDA